MRFRTRLISLITLLGVALLINLLALLLLARTFTRSLRGVQENTVRQQALALQMQASLRDAEAALYRYQIEGEAGFAGQFKARLDEFDQEVATFASLAGDEDERTWVQELEQAHRDAATVGFSLITLRDKQSANLDEMEALQTTLGDLLRDSVSPSAQEHTRYQETVDGMWASLREMSLAITAYLAAPEEGERARFAETAVAFRNHLARFRLLGGRETTAEQLESHFSALEATGSRLISGRDEQQALFAQFAAILFRTGQQIIVEEIQPQTAHNLAQAQAGLTQALSTSILVSLATAGGAAILAIAGSVLLLRHLSGGVDALLKGAERVAAGDLSRQIPIDGQDELARLSLTFNQMMADLASRERRLQARLSELEALRQVSLQLTSTLNATRVLHTITDSAQQLVGASEAHIFLCDGTGESPQFGASAWRNGTSPPQRRVPRPNGLVVNCAQTGRPQVVNHARDDPLFNTPEARAWHVQAATAFPLKLADRILGVLSISLDDREAFGNAELQILQLLADQAAVALENARLYQNVAEKQERLNLLVRQLALVQEEERRLVGLDLHDGLTQILLSAHMHLDTFSALAPRIEEQTLAELRVGRQRLQEAIEEVRWVVSELRPTELDDYGLVDGLRNYVAKLSQAEGWQLEYDTDLGTLGLPPEMETALFRIAQEAINNARKHAGTERLRVRLRHEPPHVVLHIRDWGRGFDPAKLGEESDHLGLIGMQERAALFGGELQVESRPGEGTRIQARLLLERV